MERGLIEWEGNVIPPTEYWYDVNDNCVHADCGVSIPFIYDVRTEMARCRYDIIVAVKEHYKNKNISITSTDD